MYGVDSQPWQTKLRPYLVAVLLVALASVIRWAFFTDLGRGIAYLTYFPAVALAALFGGLGAGLTATVMSGLLTFYWVQRGYVSSIEALAMATFVVSSALISTLGGAMVRARKIAIGEKEKAEAANRELQNEILERDRAERALRKSEALFQSVSRSANDAIVTADSSGNIAQWNKGAECIFGYQETDVVGKPLALLMPQRFHQAHAAGLRRVLAGGESRVMGRPVELFGLRKNGAEFPLELSLAQWQIAEGRYFTGVIRDITERKAAEAEIAAHRRRLASFASEQNLAIEAERKRLAREVHDQIGQVFTAIQLIIHSLRRDAYLPGQEAALKQALEMGIATTRRITSELRPPLLDDLGLASALEHFTTETLGSTTLVCEIDIESEDLLDSTQTLTLFRIAQEAVTNVLRHADARHVLIDGRREGAHYRFSVTDDGRGFSTAEGRKDAMGLIGMRERARLIGGACEISSGAQGGTSVKIVLPLGDNASDEDTAA